MPEFKDELQLAYDAGVKAERERWQKLVEDLRDAVSRRPKESSFDKAAARLLDGMLGYILKRRDKEDHDAI